MTNKHPLLERAHKYPRREVDLAPAGCLYDDVVGAWRVIETGELWVETPHRVGPHTKKKDIETGEDQKGE
jgi:hypothetical protein